MLLGVSDYVAEGFVALDLKVYESRISILPLLFIIFLFGRFGESYV